MKEALRGYIVDQVPYPIEEEINDILALFEEKHFKKGRLYKEPFKTSDYVAFLCEGSVRLIIHKENGDEITARILQDNSFIIDPYRLKGTDSSPLSIECLEDLTLLIASLESIQKMLETNLALNILVRKYQKEQMLEMAEIRFLFLTGTAKERYQRILENNPEMLRKFPLRFIASMIGITPTQLSRVRKKK